MMEIFKSKPTFGENWSKSKPTLGKNRSKSKPTMVGISAKYRQKGQKKTPHSPLVRDAMRRYGV